VQAGEVGKDDERKKVCVRGSLIMVDGIGFVIFLSKEVKMKRFKVMISIFFVVISLLIIMPVHSYAGDMVKVRGCVYDKKMGTRNSSPFVVRIWNRNGNGVTVSGVDGCYGGAGSSSGALELNNLIGDWDFIEVIVRNKGRVYTQQYKLPPKALDSGMVFLGLPLGVVRYDFYLDFPEQTN
jgi:hypothetical protein